MDIDVTSLFVASKGKKKSIKLTKIVKIEDKIISSERLNEFQLNFWEEWITLKETKKQNFTLSSESILFEIPWVKVCELAIFHSI